MKIQFKKTLSGAKEPTRAHEHDAGWDLYAAVRNLDGTYWEFDTGIAMAIPIGYIGLVFPRSSISKKAVGFSLRNAVGVIDPGYRQHSVKLRFMTPRGYGPVYDVGDRIGQVILIPRIDFQWEEVEGPLPEAGDGRKDGFGSTGK